MSLGGGEFCDDCGWQDCAALGFCLKPFVSPAALLGLQLTPLEAAQLLEEIADGRPPVFIGFDPGSDDLVVDVFASLPGGRVRRVKQLATACLTGVDEDPAVATAMPAAPTQGDGGISLSVPRPPSTAGTQC